MPKYSLKASLGLNIGVVQVKFEWGVEWGQRPTSGLDNYFVYLDQISELRSEVALLQSRLAVFESHAPRLTGFRSSDQLGFQRLLEGSDQVIRKSDLSAGILSLPPINHTSGSQLRLDSLDLYSLPSYFTRPYCKHLSCLKEADCGDYCVDHAIQYGIDPIRPKSDLTSWRPGLPKDPLAGVDFDTPTLAYGLCQLPNCNSPAKFDGLCLHHAVQMIRDY